MAHEPWDNEAADERPDWRERLVNFAGNAGAFIGGAIPSAVGAGLIYVGVENQDFPTALAGVAILGGSALELSEGQTAVSLAIQAGEAGGRRLAVDGLECFDALTKPAEAVSDEMRPYMTPPDTFIPEDIRGQYDPGYRSW